MGARVDYLQRDKTAGRLSYRRAFPAELRSHILGSPRELKVSLGSSTYDQKAARIFAEAAAEYDRTVSAAHKSAAGKFDELDEQLIRYLADSYLHIELRYDEDARWGRPATKRPYQPRDNHEDDYHDCRPLLDAYEGESLVMFWRDWACQYTRAMGYVVNPSSEGFKQLCGLLGEAACHVWLTIDKRRDGRSVDTPTEPANPKAIRSTPAANKTLHNHEETFEQIARRLLESERLAIGPATRQATRTALRFLNEALGPLKPSEMSKAVVSEWLDLVVKRPVNLKGKERTLPLRDIVQLYEGRDNVGRTSAKTLGQHNGMLSSIWNKAQDEGAIDDSIQNPFKRRALTPNAIRRDHVELSPDEINAIFSLPVFTAGERPKGGKGEACYWLPLLLLWTGARPEEIAQLVIDDVIKNNVTEQWMLRITDEGTHPIKTNRSLKTSKSQSGRRIIPIPKPLLDLNFLDYVNHLRSAKETALFPQLTIKGERNLLFESFGPWWGKYLKRNGITLIGERRRPAREFRHVWTTASRTCGIPREACEYIQGHKANNGSAHELYGSKEPLGRYIHQVVFADIDLTAVKSWSRRR